MRGRPRAARPPSTAAAGSTLMWPTKSATNGDARLAVDLQRRAHLLDHALVHHHDAVGHRRSASSWSCVTMIVVTPSCRCSARISCRSCTRTMRVQRRQRLVEQQQAAATWRARAPARCAAAGRPTAAPGTWPRCRAGRPAPAARSRARDRLRPRHLAVDQPVGHVVGDRQVGEQRVRLEHDAVVAPRRRQRARCRARPARCGLRSAPPARR